MISYVCLQESEAGVLSQNVIGMLRHMHLLFVFKIKFK